MYYVFAVKGTFDTFIIQKTPPGPIMNRKKRFREIFRFCEDIREKRVFPKSTTTLTPYQHSQRLRQHDVSKVNDYADIMST